MSTISDERRIATVGTKAVVLILLKHMCTHTHKHPGKAYRYTGAYRQIRRSKNSGVLNHEGNRKYDYNTSFFFYDLLVVQRLKQRGYVGRVVHLITMETQMN